jgi:hypothetical protein
MMKMNINMIEFTETQTPAFDVGQIWRDTSSTCFYIVAQLGPTQYNLVSLCTGNRWTENKKTLEALYKVLDSDFVRVTQPFTVKPG